MKYSLLSLICYGVYVVLFLLGLAAIVFNSDSTVNAGVVMILVAVFLTILTWMTDKNSELRRSMPPPISSQIQYMKVPTKPAKRAMPTMSSFNSPQILPTLVMSATVNFAQSDASGSGGGGSGAVLLYLFIMETSWDWNGVNVSSFEYLRYITLVLGTFAVWRWISNNARWEPKPLSGGRWIALVLVAIVIGSTVITVFAIIHMTQLIQLMRYLGIKGA